MDAKTMKDLQRVVFAQGTCFYSGRPIPFLQQKDLPITIVGGGKTNTCHGNDGDNNDNNDDMHMPVMDNGDAMTILTCQIFTAPNDIQKCTIDPKQLGQFCIVMDRRCSNCTNSFVDRQSLIHHCSATGHKPYFQQDEDDDNVKDGSVTPTAPTAPVPANHTEFLTFCNVVLNRAMGERMARWGRDFVDPKTAKDPSDRNGRSYGVTIFEAFVSQYNANTMHISIYSIQYTVYSIQYGTIL
jgi:hypothetical protein